MSRLVGPSPSTVVVTDASVPVNFLRIDRMDLIAGHSQKFTVTYRLWNVMPPIRCDVPDWPAKLWKVVLPNRCEVPD